MNPYVGISYSPGEKWRIEFTKYGFILWGRKKRRHYSWRFVIDGPMKFKSYKAMHSLIKYAKKKE